VDSASAIEFVRELESKYGATQLSMDISGPDAENPMLHFILHEARIKPNNR
jgi:hypothetical protein